MRAHECMHMSGCTQRRARWAGKALVVVGGGNDVVAGAAHARRTARACRHHEPMGRRHDQRDEREAEHAQGITVIGRQEAASWHKGGIQPSSGA